MAELRIADRTEIRIADGLPDQLLPKRDGRARVAILTQPGATDIALEVSRRLGDTKLACEVIGLPDRDEAKTLGVVESVYETLAKFGLSRYDTIVGVGGGSVTDVAGYVAGTWLRGVEAVYVPTTLLAAVDASIGGKTGVNIAGKNLVGVFWHPSRVVIDSGLFQRLPRYLIREGMAEAYKAGLIGDVSLVDLITRSGLDSNLEPVIEKAIAVKAKIVDQDVHEAGVRAHLNFGHTVGHAIEFASSLSHGESVGLGMIAAVRISERIAGFQDAEQVTETVAKLDLPTEVEGLERIRVLDLLGRDKKRDAKGLRMVLLREIGEAYLTHVKPSDVDVGLSAIGF